MKGMLLLPVLAVLLCACTISEYGTGGADGVNLRLSLTCEGFGSGETYRSRFAEDCLEVKDFNIWVYDGNGDIVNGAFSGLENYFSGAGGIDGSLVFPNAGDSYDVYILANVGRVPIKRIPLTKLQAETYRWTFDYELFPDTGFPMSSHLEVCPAFCSGNLPVEPLVARYDIAVVNEVDADYEFTLKSVKACNCVKSLCPFSSESGASSSSDVTSAADFFVSGADDFGARKGTLYLLENVQGEVFSNSDLRIPSTIAGGKADCASYLQFEGTYRQKDDTGYETVICRYYFGQGRNAFVKRNCRTTLTLRLTKGILENDTWTVEPIDWFNNGRVVFSPSSTTLISGQTPIVNAGSFDSSGSANPYVKYTLSYDSDAFAQAGLRLDFKTSGSSVWRNYTSGEIQGPCSLRLGTSFSAYGSREVEISATGTDGSVLSPVPLSVKVCGYPYPTAIRLVTTDFSNLSAGGKLKFDVSYSDGTVKRIEGHDSGLSLKKLSGAALLSDQGSGWNYHLSGDLFDFCTFKATYTGTVNGIGKTVSSDCSFNVWALDAESSNTRINRFQNTANSLKGSDGRNFYVSAKDISVYGTVFELTDATLCLTNGKVSKVIDVNPQVHSWTVSLRGQSSANAFSVVSSGTAFQIRRSGDIVGANAEFIVRLSSGYKDTEGHSTYVESFSVTIEE